MSSRASANSGANGEEGYLTSGIGVLKVVRNSAKYVLKRASKAPEYVHDEDRHKFLADLVKPKSALSKVMRWVAF